MIALADTACHHTAVQDSDSSSSQAAYSGVLSSVIIEATSKSGGSVPILTWKTAYPKRFLIFISSNKYWDTPLKQGNDKRIKALIDSCLQRICCRPEDEDRKQRSVS